MSSHVNWVAQANKCTDDEIKCKQGSVGTDMQTGDHLYGYPCAYAGSHITALMYADSMSPNNIFKVCILDALLYENMSMPVPVSACMLVYVEPAVATCQRPW